MSIKLRDLLVFFILLVLGISARNQVDGFKNKLSPNLRFLLSKLNGQMCPLFVNKQLQGAGVCHARQLLIFSVFGVIFVCGDKFDSGVLTSRVEGTEKICTVWKAAMVSA